MAYRGDHPAPLLPASLQDRLAGWLWKALGFLLLAACAALSASLLTWSFADPSLSRATAGSARNLLGPPGAILSDLIMQMLGLAGVFVLLPPLFWALQMMAARGPVSLRGRLLLAPLAVLFLAGALSSLPPASMWPLHNGYGGVLGDLGLGLLSSLLAHVNPERSAAAAGLFYFAAGLLVLVSSLGLSQRDLRLICRADAARPRSGTMAGWWRDMHAQMRALARRVRVEPAPAHVLEPPAFEAVRVEPEPEDEAPSAADVHRHSSVASPEVPIAARGPGFDWHTDEESRRIAERFAPASALSRSAAGDRRDPPELPLPQAAAVEISLERRSAAPCPRPPLSLLKRAGGRSSVVLREILETTAFRDADASLPIALGRDPAGAPVVLDLARLPHLLVAGAAGSGKSAGINAIILSLIYRLSPEQCRLLLIDPETADLCAFDGLPHLVCPVVAGPAQGTAALAWAVEEAERRHRRMAQHSVRNIDVFNNRVRHAQKRAGAERELAPMPHIVVVVGELADLMAAAGDRIEAALERLAPLARAAGIHLVAATRHPSPGVATTTVKAALPARICYRVASRLDSRTILEEAGAEQLAAPGELLLAAGAGRSLRVRAAYVSEQEVDNIAAFLREAAEPRQEDLAAPASARQAAGPRRKARR